VVDPFESWVPALAGAVVGIALFGYAWAATRRFDRTRRQAQAASTGKVQRAVRIETPKPARATAPTLQPNAAPPATTTTTTTTTAGNGNPGKPK